MAKQQTYDATKMGPLSWRQLQMANQEAYANLDIDDDLRGALQQVTNNMSIPNSGSPELNWEGRVQSPIMRNSNGKDYWGKSMWDEQVADAYDFENNLLDLRGQNQPWYAQLGAGVLKGVTTFGTTWLDGTVGLIYGGLKTIFNWEDKSGSERAAQIFNNEVSNALQDFNEYMEEFAPNYKSRDEENNKWYQNLGTMNFWADSFIKNLGFTVGAFYSGGAWLKVGKGLLAVSDMAKAGRAIKAAKAAGKSNMAALREGAALKEGLEAARSGAGAAAIGSLLSAVNEGRIEANQMYRDAFTNTGDWRTSKGAAKQILMEEERAMQEIADNPLLSDAEKEIQQQQIRSRADELLKQAEEKAATAGMWTLAANIPILTVDNWLMYGKLFSRGYKINKKDIGKNLTTAEEKAAAEAQAKNRKKIDNITERAKNEDLSGRVESKDRKYFWNDITTGEALWKGFKGGLREGNEEMAQAFISESAAASTMPEDPDAYYKALTDPNAQIKTNNFLTSITTGFTKSYGNMDRWEEGFIGFLTGIFGTPTFGKVNNSDSNTYLGKGKMIGMSGGLFAELSNASYMNNLGQEAVKRMNEFTQKYQKHGQFLAQNQSFTDAMDGLVKEEDGTHKHFAYNNTKDNQDFAMLSAFAVTGRLNDVIKVIDVDSLTDADLESIANGFTVGGEQKTSDGTPVTTDAFGMPLKGAWRDKNGTLLSDEKAISPDSDKKEYKDETGREYMRRKLKEKQTELTNEIYDYIDSVDNARAMSNNSRSEDEIRELAWYDWKNKQWTRRFWDIQDKQSEGIKALIKGVQTALDKKNEEDESKYYYTDEEDSPIKRERLVKLKELLEKMQTAESPRELLGLLAENTQTISSLFTKPEKDSKEATLYDVVSGWMDDINAFNDVAEALYDIRLMALSQKQFRDRLEEFKNDPAKLAENRAKIDAERTQEQAITNDIEARQKLRNMSVSAYSDMSDDEKKRTREQAKYYGDETALETIGYSEQIDAKSESIVSASYGDTSLTDLTKQFIAEAVQAMKDKAQRPEEIDVESEAYKQWLENKKQEYKDNKDVLNVLDSLASQITNKQRAYEDDYYTPTTAYSDGSESSSSRAYSDESAPAPTSDYSDDTTGHDGTTKVQSVREQQKEEKRKEEEKNKKEKELSFVDKLWETLIDAAPEDNKDEVRELIIPIRDAIDSWVDKKKKNEAKNISDKEVKSLKRGIYPSRNYSRIKEIVGDNTKNIVSSIIDNYIEYINGLLAKNVTESKEEKQQEEEPRTPVIQGSEIDTYAESQNKNIGTNKGNLHKSYWLPRTTQYGIGSTEFSKPKFDESGRQLKFWERVNKGEGNYSPKLRAKIVTVGRWLDEHGVFDNVDGALSKTLKKGTEVLFTTSQELNNLVAEAMWKADGNKGDRPNPVIILMAVGNDLHIIGDMAEPDLANLGNQEKHLSDFVNDFNKKYGEWLNDSTQDHSKPFVHPNKSKIGGGLIGRMIYNEKKDRNTLNSIFRGGFTLGVALEDKDSKEIDVIVNPDKKQKDPKNSVENNIIQPIAPKAGQPYIVVPSLISGKYICVPFTVPSLSAVLSRDDSSSIEIIKKLRSTIEEIANIDYTKSADDIKSHLIAAKDDLEALLNVNLFIEYKNGKLTINRKSDGKYIKFYTEPIKNIGNGFVDRVLTELSNAGVGFQIDRKQINSGNYNSMIGEIATTNLPVNTEYHTKNDWFIVEPINVDSGKRFRTNGVETTGINHNASTKSVKITRTANGKSIDIFVDLENDTVSYIDDNGAKQVVSKSEFGTKENAAKAWAYAIGQARGIFKERPNKNTLPYQTKNNDEYFDPYTYRFLHSKEEFDELCKQRSTMPTALNILLTKLQSTVSKDVTIDTEDSKSGYPTIVVTTTTDDGSYIYKFRVTEEGNIESASGWASDNPSNWEEDNALTKRGKTDTSFTSVKDFYEALGFTPKPASTTTTQTTNDEKSYAEKSGFVFRPVSEWKQEHSVLEVYPFGKTVGCLQYESNIKAMQVALTMLSIFKSAKDHQDLHDRLVSRSWGMPANNLTIMFGYWEAFKDGRISEQEVLDLFTPNSNDRVSVPTSTKQSTTEQAPSTEITREEREEIIKNNQVQLPSNKFPSGNNNIGGYLGLANEGEFGKIDDKYDEWDSYYRIFDVQGDTAKFEFYGNEERAIENWSSVLSIVADWKGKYKTGNAIYTLEAGEVKKNSNGKWVVTKRAKLQLVKKEDIVDNVYTDTEAVKRDIDSLQRRKNKERQDWENKINREQEQIKEYFEDSFDVEEASPEVEQAIGEVIQGTNLGLSIDEVFKQNSNLEQLYNSNPQFKDSVDSLRRVMEENKQKEEEQKAKEQQIAEEPVQIPDDIVKKFLGNPKDKEYPRMWEALSDKAKEAIIKEYVKDAATFNRKMNKLKKYWNTKQGKFTLEPKFKRVVDQPENTWNRDEEMAWLKKVLPQLSDAQRVQVVDGLIKVNDEDNPGYAYGQYLQGLITISSNAASGTLYHEAFHAVVDKLLSEKEYKDLFDAALEVYGNLGMLGLEEKLAEEFRRFVQYGDNAAFVDYDAEDIKTPIIRGIVRLFRRLKALIQGLRNKEIYLNKLFYDINKGKFANRKIKGDILDKVTVSQEKDAQLILDRNPELASVGTAREYAAYVNDIFPNSVEKGVHWLGTKSDIEQFRQWKERNKNKLGGNTTMSKYFLGKNMRKEIEARLKKYRPDMKQEEIDSVLDFLHSLQDTKEDTAYIKTAVTWILNNSIRLPEDYEKTRQIFDVARKKHIDIQKYKTFGELISSPELRRQEKEKKSFDPDKAKTFSNKKTVTTASGRVFTVYDVENTEEGQRDVCHALAAHYESSPWCLSTFTKTGEPTESAKNYWDHYNAIPRKIAFENGKPVAFSSRAEQDYDNPDYIERQIASTEKSIEKRESDKKDFEVRLKTLEGELEELLQGKREVTPKEIPALLEGRILGVDYRTLKSPNGDTLLFINTMSESRRYRVGSKNIYLNSDNKITASSYTINEVRELEAQGKAKFLHTDSYGNSVFEVTEKGKELFERKIDRLIENGIVEVREGSTPSYVLTQKGAMAIAGDKKKWSKIVEKEKQDYYHRIRVTRDFIKAAEQDIFSLKRDLADSKEKLERLKKLGKEAWWDMEDTHPQPTLSDSIMANNPRISQQINNQLRETRRIFPDMPDNITSLNEAEDWAMTNHPEVFARLRPQYVQDENNLLEAARVQRRSDIEYATDNLIKQRFIAAAQAEGIDISQETADNFAGFYDYITDGIPDEEGGDAMEIFARNSNISVEDLDRLINIYSDSRFSVNNDDINEIVRLLNTEAIAQARYSRVRPEVSIRQYHFQKLIYGNLSESDREYIKEIGLSVDEYNSLSTEEKEHLWKCR